MFFARMYHILIAIGRAVHVPTAEIGTYKAPREEVDIAGYIAWQAVWRETIERACQLQACTRVSGHRIVTT